MAAKICPTQQNTLHVLGWYEKHANTPQYLATKHEALKPYASAVEKGMRLRSSLTHHFLGPMINFVRLSKVESRKLKQAIEYFDAIGKSPDLSGDTLTFTVTGTRPNGNPLDLVGSKSGDTITLEGQTLSAFRDIRNRLDSYYDHLIKANKTALGLDPNLPIDETFKEQNPNGYAFLKTLEESRREGYMPRVRAGDVGFRVTFPDGRKHFYVAAPQGFDRIKMGKSRIKAAEREATNIKDSLKSKYNLSDDAFGPMRLMEQDTIVEEMRAGSIDHFEALMATLLDPRKLGDIYLKDAEGNLISPLLTTLRQMREEVGKQGAKAHLRRRKDEPGYLHPANFDNYFESVLSSYLIRGADYIGTLYAAKDRSDAINNLPNNNLKVWARAHNDAMHQPQSLAWMKNVAFNYSLGWNISSAAVNLTQTLHTTWPYLSMLSNNPGRASMEIMKAFRNTAQLIKNPENAKIFTIDEEFFDPKKIAKLPPDERKFIEGLINQGIIKPVMTQELLSQDSRVSYGPLYDKLSPVFRNFTQSASWMFGSVEQINRMTAALAAYRMLKSDPRMVDRAIAWKQKATIYTKEPNTLEFLARMAVEDTQFVVTKENRPMFMQGNIPSVVTQFQQYPMAMLELMMKIARFADPKQKAVFGALMALGIIGTAGIWGLPFARPLFSTIDGISKMLSPILGEPPVEAKKWIQDLVIEFSRLLNSDDPTYLADYIQNGFARALGVDLSRRTALEIIPTDLLSGESLDMIGPFGGVVLGGIKQAYDYHNSGHPGLALASLLPLAARNAYSGATGQYITPGSGRSRIPIGTQTMEENVAKVMGFTPTRMARISEQASMLSDRPMDATRKNIQNTIASHYIDAMLWDRIGNSAAADESRNKAAAILNWASRESASNDSPTKRIIVDPVEFMEGIKERILRDLEGPLGPTAMKSRGNKQEQAAKLQRLKENYPNVN